MPTHKDRKGRALLFPLQNEGRGQMIPKIPAQATGYESISTPTRNRDLLICVLWNPKLLCQLH
jgi:hypothetical protein